MDLLLGTENRKDRTRSRKETIKTIQTKVLRLLPKLILVTPGLHSRSATDRPKTTKTILPLIPKVVWRQTRETDLIDIHNQSDTETLKNMHTPQVLQWNDVESQMSPPNGLSLQKSGPEIEPFLEN